MPIIYRVLLKDEKNQVFLVGNEESPFSMFLQLPEAGTAFNHDLPDGVQVGYRIQSVAKNPRYLQGDISYVAVVERLDSPIVKPMPTPDEQDAR